MPRSSMIKIRRDTDAQWIAENPVLAEGELGIAIDTLAYKVGDGVTPWRDLAEVGVSNKDREKLTDLSAGFIGSHVIEGVSEMDALGDDVDVDLDGYTVPSNNFGKFAVAKVGTAATRMYVWDDVMAQWVAQVTSHELAEVENKAKFILNVPFENVNNVVVDYSSFPSRPIVEAWIRDNLGGHSKGEPVLDFDTTGESLTVSFGGTYQSGYLILK